LTYASPQEFLNASDAGATGLFCGYFKTFIAVAFPPTQKNLDFPASHVWCTKLGARRIYKLPRISRSSADELFM
jgi:hypothetical protein